MLVYVCNVSTPDIAKAIVNSQLQSVIRIVIFFFLVANGMLSMFPIWTRGGNAQMRTFIHPNAKFISNPPCSVARCVDVWNCFPRFSLQLKCIQSIIDWMQKLMKSALCFIRNICESTTGFQAGNQRCVYLLNELFKKNTTPEESPRGMSRWWWQIYAIINHKRWVRTQRQLQKAHLCRVFGVHTQGGGGGSENAAKIILTLSHAHPGCVCMCVLYTMASWRFRLSLRRWARIVERSSANLFALCTYEYAYWVLVLSFACRTRPGLHLQSMHHQGPFETNAVMRFLAPRNHKERETWTALNSRHFHHQKSFVMSHSNRSIMVF